MPSIASCLHEYQMRLVTNADCEKEIFVLPTLDAQNSQYLSYVKLMRCLYETFWS